MSEDKKAKDKKEAAEKVHYCVLEVVGVKDSAPLRATDFGAKPMLSGSQVKVLSSIRDRMMKQYEPFLKLVKKEELGGPLKQGHWELVKVAKAGGKGKEPAKVKEGDKTPENKSMDGKGATAK